MASRPTFLVTGASGFVGRHVVAALAARFPDATVRTLAGRLADARAGVAPFVERFDGVFHLAARTARASGPESADDARSVIEANVTGLDALLAALDGRCERLVFASTLDVYRPPGEGEILHEASPLGPTSIYGASKVLGETLVRAWSARHGVPFAILRLTHVYGPGERRYRKLIPVAIERALAGEPIAVSGDGSALRDVLYVADAAHAFVAAWQRLSTGSLDTINVATGRSVSVLEVARTIAALVPGTRLALEGAPAAPQRSYRFDVARMGEALGVAVTPLEAGLRAEIDSYGAQPRG